MMTLISGYQIVTKIHESTHSLVYRGYRDSDNCPVVIKILKKNYPTPAELTRYKQEYEIARSLNLEGAIAAYHLERYQNTLAIVFEDFGGDSLKILMESRKFTLAEFFTIAIKITESLGNIHGADIIHKDINPSNLVFNPNTGELKIIDFGISTVLSWENQPLHDPNLLEGTLAYISPEQTGRMNRSLDYRTDFYSLGATFYKLLTHQLPFETTDAMELVHAHIAKQPIPPHILQPEIPRVVSELVMKLLAKTAEERYQSAWGVKADLEECRLQWQTQRKIAAFPLARHDGSDKFNIPQKLYGREQEIAALMSAFEQVSQGESQLMLVSGYSGVGKSALVREIYKPITRQRGYFIAGKFDQFQRNIPYSALIQAFQSLIQQILTESSEQIQKWREKLLAALGVNGQVMIEVVPEVELIVGEQPKVVELSPAESQNRFNLVLQNFLQVFTQPEHPLALFLDDLQWADSASLKLIQRLVTEPNRQYLFLVGAYRDNEVDAAHPLQITLTEIERAGAEVRHLSLAPLTLVHVNQLIVDTLKCSRDRADSLAQLVIDKTNGNPFFMSEFLKSLHGENLIRFDFTSGEWQWDLRQIEQTQMTDNVVELMAGKIDKLSEETQEILKLAACIGNQFDLKTLSIVRQTPQLETAGELWQAIQMGLILPVGNAYKLLKAYEEEVPDALKVNYRFLHDRVQQAAYSLIPEAQKQAVHLRIGGIWLDSSSLDKQDDQLFDIVNQLNFGRELIRDRNEKSKLAHLNLTAGQKAKASVAYEPALNYFQMGIGLLESDCWQSQYDLTLTLYRSAAEAAYLSTDFEQMERLAEVVLERANTLLERVQVYEVKIQAYAAQNKLLDAIATALEVLNLLGVKLPEKPTRRIIRCNFLKTKLILAFKSIEDLGTLPRMSDPDKLAAMRILGSAIPATFIAAPYLFPLIVLKQINLSVRYGNAPMSPFAYSTYGLLLCGMVDDIESGYRFGQLALNLLTELNTSELKAKILFIVNDFITHWKKPAQVTLPPLLEAYAAGLETGDLEFAAYSVFIYVYHSYFLGKNLANLEQETAEYINAIAQFKQTSPLNWHKLYHQAMLNLMGTSENPCRLVGEAYDEAQMLPIHQAAKDRTIIYQLYLHKLILYYLFGEYEQAVAYAVLAEGYLNSAIATLRGALFHWYDSLARLAIYPNVSPSEQKQLLKKVATNQEKLKRWARYAPENYSHKYYLVEAERYRLLERINLARDNYERATELAKVHDYLNEEALANELTAKFYLGQGKEKLARVYLLDARYSYLKWGATAKVMDLEQNYPQFFATTQSHRTDIKTSESSTESTSGKSLDLATVVKASQAISGEIMLDKLLAKLMKILIENAGAQRGFLIMEDGENLRIEAQGAVEREQIAVMQSAPLNSDSPQPELASSVVNYVARTQEYIVLNDAAGEGQFTNDPYIKTHQVKSILCAPLINQGKLACLVYLENNLTAGAFTKDRLEVLKLLSSQAAISIDLAKLYAEVRASERRLTQFLEAMPVGVGVLDAKGNPYYANQKAKELLGKGVIPLGEPEEISETYELYEAGTNRLYPPEKLTLMQALKGVSSTNSDLEIHRGDEVIPVETWGTPIFDEKGNVAYAIVAFQNITERKRAEAERQKFTNKLVQLSQAYERFVPSQFLQLLNKESMIDVQLGDQVQKEMSILFSDIRNFTALSETMTPEDNFKFINAYLSRMSPDISNNQGFIDKYIGDAIMALFSGAADNAVKAGIAMLHRLAEYNQHRRNRGYVPIKIGIGINTGSLMLGTVGEQNRMDSTVISDAVNLASRVEGLTKNYGVSLLISHQTFSRLQQPDDYCIRTIDNVKVKGKSELVTVYEVFDADAPDSLEKKLSTKTRFEQGLFLYDRNRFEEAAECFRDCLQENPQDRVSQIYLARC